jgi:hypothetical protein
MQKLLSDPVKLGPGIWYTIHIKAKLATNEKAKQEFVDYMYLLHDEFPCLNCRKHIQEYMSSHPFDLFENMTNENGKEIGMFKWTWMFHNAVNTRLNKPYLDWETAREMYNIDYDNIVPCTHCGGMDSKEINSKDSKEEKEEKIIPISKNKIIQGYFLQKGIQKTLNDNFSFSFE